MVEPLPLLKGNSSEKKLSTLQQVSGAGRDLRGGTNLAALAILPAHMFKGCSAKKPGTLPQLTEEGRGLTAGPKPQVVTV